MYSSLTFATYVSGSEPKLVSLFVVADLHTHAVVGKGDARKNPTPPKSAEIGIPNMKVVANLFLGFFNSSVIIPPHKKTMQIKAIIFVYLALNQNANKVNYNIAQFIGAQYYYI